MPSSPRPDGWDVIYYRTTDGGCPADDFLDGCPVKVSAQLVAVLDDVAGAPPPRYSGGGRWEAMHGGMRGFYEVRAQGPRRDQFRLFCVLENGTAQERTLRVAPDTFSGDRRLAERASSGSPDASEA